MAGIDLPNGFTGYAGRSAGFESAGEAIRKARAGSETPFQPAPPGSFTYTSAYENAETEQEEFDYEALDATPVLDQRWAWLEIDLNAIRHNTRATKQLLKHPCRLMAIVKADAYGHGAVECANAALGSGADHLGVATVPEAVELRRAGIKAPILILAQPPATSIPLLLAYNIMPAVYDTEFAIAYGEAADRHGMVAPYHLAVNTGMNRIGVRFDEAAEFVAQVSFHRALELAGVFTHFATADCPETFDFQIQYRRFVDAVESIRAAGFDTGLVHCANSAAIYRYPETHFDMVRLGLSLYGFHTCPETYDIVELRPAMSVHARITDARNVPVSEGVSYGLHYRSPGSVQICTVPLGYADGLRRGLSGNIDFIVDGHYYHQVGNICMDQCMFEVDLRNFSRRDRRIPQVGDEVLIVGTQGIAQVTIDEMAEKLGTIQHEVAIGFSHRMPRIFK
ncbi:MAG: alanine racemase [Eggerthellaceae bacterium]|nr:alanine racemase [Eggerthellaceae bacterium]